MIEMLKKKLYSLFNINDENKFTYECIKICLLYSIIGLLWVYCSDKIAYNFVYNKEMLVIANTYKGWFYVFVTTAILYLLINRLLNKIRLTENELNNSNNELEAANEELQAYVEQLTAAEEELRNQYNHIIESDKKLKKSEEKSRSIIKALPDILFIIDYDGNFIDCQTSDETLLLMSQENFIGKNFSQVLPKEVAKLGYEKIQLLLSEGKLQTFEYVLNIMDNERYFEIRIVKNGDNQILSICRDITMDKQNKLKLEYLSYHDQLTGIYNRRFYEEEIQRLNNEQNFPLTLVMGDVNGLKLINDSFGHTMGDKLLIKVTEVLKKGFRDSDIIARLGGDEFVIILPKTDRNEAKKMIESVHALAEKEKIGTINVSISFGSQTKRNENEEIEEIFKSAEDYMYKSKLFESPSMRGETIETIINTLHEKNKREEAHSHRVSALCKSMGKALCLSDVEIKELETVGLLHDIGKIAIEENILNKPGKLTSEEWLEIKRHPEIGYRILSTVNDLADIAEYALAHHEAWNGTGYPKGLKGEEIPIQARIINIADAYDAMTSERSYRNALPEDVAIKELIDKSGIQFDAKLVKIFIEKVLNK